MKIGEKIFELRKKNGLSQGTLAEYLNVSRQAVSKWETGQSIPDVDKIMKLSEIFHITVDDLVKDSNSIENEQNSKSEFEKARNKISGYILIATGLLLIALSFSTLGYTLFPGIILLIIGVEWLLIKNNLLLVIAWTIFFISILIFNPWTTGITNKWIIHAILSGTVYTGIIIGIIQRIVGILLFFVTVLKLVKFWQSQSTKRTRAEDRT